MILVAIPVHEREALVRHCLATAAELDLPAGGEILVIDDASPTLDAPALIAEAGLKCRFERHEERVGAERMAQHMWGRFLATGHSHLLCLDSDMVINRDAVTVGLRLAGRFDGLLTLYNSIAHASEPLDAELVAKRTVGNGATLWSRRLVETAQTLVQPVQTGVDFAYCRAFAERGIPIAATAQSRVQHIGIYGTYNQHFGALEHGLGFVPDSLAQWQAIGFIYDEIMCHQEKYLPPAPKRDLVSRVRRLLGAKI